MIVNEPLNKTWLVLVEWNENMLAKTKNVVYHNSFSHSHYKYSHTKLYKKPNKNIYERLPANNGHVLCSINVTIFAIKYTIIKYSCSISPKRTSHVSAKRQIKVFLPKVLWGNLTQLSPLICA